MKRSRPPLTPDLVRRANRIYRAKPDRKAGEATTDASIPDRPLAMIRRELRVIAATGRKAVGK